MRSAVIVDIVRTASGKGKRGGALSDVHPVDLLATVRILVFSSDEFMLISPPSLRRRMEGN